MSEVEELWEPRWDFGRPVEPYLGARMPYDLDDPDVLGALAGEFPFGCMISMPIWDSRGRRVLWAELAERLGNELTPTAPFCEAIGISGDAAQRRIVHEYDEPYFGQIDIATWQSLRRVFGLPDHGVLYADYVLYSDDGGPAAVVGAPLQKSAGGYRYLSGACTGESTTGMFHTDAGSSCCWVEGDWFATVGLDLSRMLVCCRERNRFDALMADVELEAHPLWSQEG